MRRRTSLNIIICIILTAVLIVETIAVIGITIVKETVCNKNYILNQLDKVNYYQITKSEIEDAFKYYVLQSNLDDECVSDLITVEKVKKDTIILLNQCFELSEEKIEVESIKQELNRRIYDKVENEYNNIITESEKNDIETLVNIIVENYTDNMDMINSCFKVLNAISNKLKRISKQHIMMLYGATIVTVLLLSLIYMFGIKKKRIILNKYHAIAFMTVGIMIIIVIIFMSVLIKEDQIQLFTKGITSLIVDTIISIKRIILLLGILLFVFGVGISVLKNILLRKYLR